MGESNDTWGQLAEHDDELAEAWDRLPYLPEAGVNVVLDDFCASKNIDIPALARIGTRLAGTNVIAHGGPGYIRYRSMVGDQKRWVYPGSEYPALKIVPARSGKADTVIVAEGETDAARLTMLYPEVDVAITAAGAKHFRTSYGDQLDGYERVLAAYDKDEAGDNGWAKLSKRLPHAVRFLPPGAGEEDGPEDWCAYEGEPPALPAPGERPATLPILVSAGELMNLELPEQASWFEQDLLPIGGQLVLHGYSKSFKSFLALDLMSALAQHEDWAGFEPTEEPCRVAVVQFEITPHYYRKRIAMLRRQAREPELFDENFLTWEPLRRPQLRAGVKEQEDHMRRVLVEHGVQVVLIDPVRRTMGAGLNMNDEQGARVPLAFFESLQNEGLTVVFCHHDTKASARTGGGDSLAMTGSGAWSGDADTIVSVELPKDVKTEDPKRNLKFLLRNAPSPRARGFEIRDERIVYSPEPWGVQDPDDPDAPGI